MGALANKRDAIGFHLGQALCDDRGDIKQPHLILKMAPSSVIHHVKVDVNIISTK